MRIIFITFFLLPISLMAQNEDIHLKELYTVMTDDSALIHMTGMRQPRREYLRAIADGTLNYYSCTDSDVKVTIQDGSAWMRGCSQVNAAVFGGGCHTWPLRLDIDWKKEDDGKWRITEIRASTY